MAYATDSFLLLFFDFLAAQRTFFLVGPSTTHAFFVARQTDRIVGFATIARGTALLTLRAALAVAHPVTDSSSDRESLRQPARRNHIAPNKKLRHIRKIGKLLE